MEGLFAFVAHTSMVDLHTIAAESEKFTAPLLFVHGLWCDANVWRRAMGYCAHRGWTCHALTLPRVAADGVSAADLPAWIERVRAQVRRFDAAPVLIGHDVGAWLAMTMTAEVRAVVALAPLLATTIEPAIRALVPAWRLAWSGWRGMRVDLPARGAARLYRGEATGLGEVVPEAAGFLRALPDRLQSLPRPLAGPTLIVGGAADEFAPPASVRACADRCGADYEIMATGRHPLPWETGWEKTMGQVHRWLVRRLGEELLLPQEEEED